MEWIPEAYDISREPCLYTTFHVKSDHGPSNFPRATKWCVIFLVLQSSLTKLTYFQVTGWNRCSLPVRRQELPVIWSVGSRTPLSRAELTFWRSSDQGSHESSQPTMKLYPSKVFNQAAPILDFIWFPTATPHDPASFCFVASVRECPVKLLDASDGRVSSQFWRYICAWSLESSAHRIKSSIIERGRSLLIALPSI